MNRLSIALFSLWVNLFTSCFHPATAQNPSESEPLPRNPVPELQKVPALQATISFEARRMPLSDLLAALQKQSGIAFKSGADFPSAKTLVTLRLKEMTLASLMGTLSRLYGVRWIEENGGWTMRASDQSTLRVKLLRTIGMSGRSSLAKKRVLEQQTAELVEDIYNSADETAWRAKEGVPFTKLPEEVRQRLYDRLDVDQSQWLINCYLEEMQAFEQKLVLRIGKVAPDVPTLFPGQRNLLSSNAREYFEHPQLAIYTEDGRFVTNIFPTFRPPVETIAPLPEAPLQTPDAR